MSGMQLRDELLREPRFAAVPVVIVSAGGDVAAKAAAMGVEGLTKPIAIDVLLRTLERFAGDAPDDDE
jgi:FixJ family two-component response regulator